MIAPAAVAVKERLRILLAEDNLFNQRIATLTLQREGHTVCAVGDGREALAALERGEFDVVLMDVEMPTMDGLEATAAIRRGEGAFCRHLPVIALTAHADETDRARCRAAGMDACLTKPIQPASLRETLAGLAAPATAAANGKAADGGPTPVFDRDRALARVGGDPALLREVIELFANDSTRLMGEVEEALRGGDAERLRKAAHTLKGSVAFFAAPAAEDAARRLEREAADLPAAGRAARLLSGEIARLRNSLRDEGPA